MTVKDLIGRFIIKNNQKIKITDETLQRSYESDEGSFCFEFYENLFDHDYEKCLEYIQGMKVDYFSVNEDGIWIRAWSK